MSACFRHKASEVCKKGLLAISGIPKYVWTLLNLIHYSSVSKTKVAYIVSYPNRKETPT